MLFRSSADVALVGSVTLTCTPDDPTTVATTLTVADAGTGA